MEFSGAYFVMGTDTSVGKTHATEYLIRHVRGQHRRAWAMKPISSGGYGQDDLLNEDVARLMSASGQTDRALMNPYHYPDPVSPHIAIERSRRVPDFDHISENLARLLQGAECVFVEGAGGVCSPISDELDFADLAVHLNLPVILVVGIRLGCLNHARLSAAALASRGLTLAGWIANCLDPNSEAIAENVEYLDRFLPAPRIALLPFELREF